MTYENKVGLWFGVFMTLFMGMCMFFIWLIEWDCTSRHSGSEINSVKESNKKHVNVIWRETSFCKIEIDGHWYLEYLNKNVIHMESCPCRNEMKTDAK